MPELSLGDAKFGIAVGLGLALIVLARWASRTRGTKLDSWVALRIGDVLFTEVAGAFILGYGLGGLIAQPDAVARGGPQGGPVISGRFGRLGGLATGLQYSLAVVGAAIAIFTRLDVSGLLLRGSPPRDGLATFLGRDASVIAPIAAGGYGQIAMKDEMGYPLAAVATAEVDIPTGTPVRVVGTKGINLLVAPVSSG